jgi:hypothetical protein
VIAGVAGLVTTGIAGLVTTGIAGLVTTGIAGLVIAGIAGLVTTGIAGMTRKAVVVAEAAPGLVALLGKVALLGRVARLRRVARLPGVVTTIEASAWVARLRGVVIMLVPAQACGWITETGFVSAWSRSASRPPPKPASGRPVRRYGAPSW